MSSLWFWFVYFILDAVYKDKAVFKNIYAMTPCYLFNVFPARNY